MEQSDAEQRKTERERNRKSIIRKRDGWRRDGEEDHARERERERGLETLERNACTMH